MSCGQSQLRRDALEGLIETDRCKRRGEGQNSELKRIRLGVGMKQYISEMKRMEEHAKGVVRGWVEAGGKIAEGGAHWEIMKALSESFDQAFAGPVAYGVALWMRNGLGEADKTSKGRSAEAPVAAEWRIPTPVQGQKELSWVRDSRFFDQRRLYY